MKQSNYHLKREKNGLRKNLVFYFQTILIFVMLPCVVHIDVVRSGMEKYAYYPDTAWQSDFFMHLRSLFLLFAALLGVGDSFLFVKGKDDS